MTRRVALVVLSLHLLLTGALASQTTWPTKDWPSVPPEAVGLDSKVLAAFDAEIAAGQYGLIDSFLVIRRGQVAFERVYRRDYDTIYGDDAKKPGGLNATDPTGPFNYFNPWWHPYYRRGDLHTMQSVTKTITSVIIGVAVTRKEFPDLDTPVLKYFDESQVKNVDDRKRRMTIRHLLTMTAGQDWREDLPSNDPKNTTSVMEASFDWLQVAIDHPMVAEPGTVFNYNSGATVILAHIFRKATGVDIEEYAHRHLFTPLGIERFYWKRTAMGLIDAEGGLYLRPRDLARIAYLFLKDGQWDGRTLIDPAWVKASVTPAVTVSATAKYGYKWWLHPYGEGGTRLAWAGSGFGGQRPLIFPEHDLIVIYTGWDVQRPGMPLRVAMDRVLQALR